MDQQILQGKVAFVTGAAKGIGMACAVAMAEAGADVILGLKEISSGKEVSERIRKAGRDVLRVKMDISSIPEINQAVQAGLDHFHRIDILVNNAGIGAPNSAEDVNEK